MTEIHKALIAESRTGLAALVCRRVSAIAGVQVVVLRAGGANTSTSRTGTEQEIVDTIESESVDTFVYSPLDTKAWDNLPNLVEAEHVFESCAKRNVRQIVLLSSAAVYGADYHNPGLIRESRIAQSRRPNRIAEAWRRLEALANQYLPAGGATLLTILRPVLTPVSGANDWASRLFRKRWAHTVAGFNPTIQLLDPADLAEAIGRAVEGGHRGVFNVAPDRAIPLRRALRVAGVRSVPIPWTLQRLSRAILSRLGCAASTDQLDYLRYSWTACNERSCRALQVAYRSSSLGAAQTLDATRPVPRNGQPADDAFDDYGMDERYIRVGSRRWLGFLNRRYWRIEVDGLEHIPRTGRAVLTGVHRGFMPFDGVMFVHLLSKHLGRIPRFLLHPALIKFPFLADFLTKLGGIVACQDNADHVLQQDEMLGIFPEGIRGAFRLYRDAYTLGRFGRCDFIKMALLNQAPIVPFVFVGTAEMFPILGKFEWSWWKKHTEWPFFPITPTFPLLPVPLPTKWHLQILPPIHLHERYSPEAASDARVVQRIGEEIRQQMQQALQALRARRRSIFCGSIFGSSSPAALPLEPLNSLPTGQPSHVEESVVSAGP